MTVVEGVEQAAEAMMNGRADLVVIDVGVENPERICQAVKKNRETSLTSIIVIGAEGYDPKLVKDLTVLSDVHSNDPLELNLLLKISESELGRTAEERNYFDHVLHFRLQTKDEQIEAANDLVSHALANVGFG